MKIRCVWGEIEPGNNCCRWVLSVAEIEADGDSCFGCGAFAVKQVAIGHKAGVAIGATGSVALGAEYSPW